MTGGAQIPGLGWPGLLTAYPGQFGIAADARVITLQEGGTPLLPAPALSERLGVQVWLKVEGANPTGSFEDRGMTVVATRAVAAGAGMLVCASTGNTGVSAAAYAARAGLSCAVLLPQGQVAEGKVAQALAYGARVIQVQGGFSDCLRLIRGLAHTHPQITTVNATDPARILGLKTVAYEVCDVLGRAPDVHIVPVGGGANLTATWLGYREYYRNRLIDTLPEMFGFQATGVAAMLPGPNSVDQGTVAALRVGRPATRFGALRARDESGGFIDAVTDRQIRTAYHLVAACEGVFVEPASAAAIAGLLAAVDDGRLPAGSVVVCTVTGNGLKDPATAVATMADPEVIPVDAAAVIHALDLHTTPGEELLDDTTDPDFGDGEPVTPWTDMPR